MTPTSAVVTCELPRGRRARIRDARAAIRGVGGETLPCLGVQGFVDFSDGSEDLFIFPVAQEGQEVGPELVHGGMEPFRQAHEHHLVVGRFLVARGLRCVLQGFDEGKGLLFVEVTGSSFCVLVDAGENRYNRSLGGLFEGSNAVLEGFYHVGLK